MSGDNIYSPNINTNPIIYTAVCDQSFTGKKGLDGDKEVLFYAWILIAALLLMGLPFPELSFTLFSLGMVATIALGMWQVTWVLITPIIIVGFMINIANTDEISPNQGTHLLILKMGR